MSVLYIVSRRDTACIIKIDQSGGRPAMLEQQSDSATLFSNTFERAISSIFGIKSKRPKSTQIESGRKLGALKVEVKKTKKRKGDLSL